MLITNTIIGNFVISRDRASRTKVWIYCNNITSSHCQEASISDGRIMFSDPDKLPYNVKIAAERLAKEMVV